MAKCPECNEKELEVVKFKNGRFAKACGGGKGKGGCGYTKLISKAKAEELGASTEGEPKPADEPKPGDGGKKREPKPQQPSQEPKPASGTGKTSGGGILGFLKRGLDFD
ncbi:MAG TPA: hypothetical protein VMU24_02395 [Candidatus Acidoferrales bacterium]|nr:hypothetical protein [Candidatus Acidoferrales bacterium]